jgi:hypothetical protein
LPPASMVQISSEVSGCRSPIRFPSFFDLLQTFSYSCWGTCGDMVNISYRNLISTETRRSSYSLPLYSCLSRPWSSPKFVLLSLSAARFTSGRRRAPGPSTHASSDSSWPGGPARRGWPLLPVTAR